MALCSNCGKDNREGSRFCQSCGTPISPPEVPKTQAQASGSGKRSSQELAPAPVCSACGTLNAPGMRFCKMCGSPLEAPKGQAAKLSCPSCGGQTPTGYKFCQHCGSPLPKAGSGPAASVAAAAPQPAAPASVSAAAAAPASAEAAPAPAAAGPAPASLTTPAGGSPIQADAVIAAAQVVPKPRNPTPARPVPVYSPAAAPSPLQAAIGPAAELVGAAAGGSADMARTIIEMNRPTVSSVAEVSPAPAAVASVAAALSDQAPVSGQIQTQTPPTPASGMPSAAPIPAVGKSTVGPGAAKAPIEEAAELARLVSVNRDGTDGDVHRVNEESVDLGRTDGQLLFNDDPYLSERHCRFCIRNERWQVQDLQSCNGVFVRVRGTRDLRHGDRLLLGKQVLTFELLAEHERALAPAVQHGVLVFGSPLRTPWGRLRQITVAGIYRDVYFLYRPQITIGREEGDILFPDDEFMSRQHLRITLSGTKTQIQDLQSSNGTFLQIREPEELEEGVLIRVGDQLLRFEPA